MMHTRDIVRMKIARKFRGGLIKSRSKAEEIFESLLQELGLACIRQAIFLNKKTFYIVDFYLKPPHRIVIEIDGPEHTLKKAILRRDREEEFFFRGKEIRVLRFEDERILNALDETKRELGALLGSNLKCLADG